MIALSHFMSTCCPRTNLILEALPSEFPIDLIQHIISPYLIPPTPEDVFIQLLSKYEHVQYFFTRIGEEFIIPSNQLTVYNCYISPPHIVFDFQYKKPQPLSGSTTITFLTDSYILYKDRLEYEQLFE